MSTAEQDQYLATHFNVDFSKRGATSAARAPGGPKNGAAVAQAKPPGGPKAKPPSVDDRLKKLEEASRGHTKVDIAHEGALFLQKQYDAMVKVLEGFRDRQQNEVAGWKAHQTPTGGTLLLVLCKGFSKAAGLAFPEVELIKFASERLDIAGDAAEGVKTAVDSHNDAGKEEVEALKGRARLQLERLVTHASDEISTTREKLEALIKQAIAKLSPEELEQMEGLNEPQLIGDFVREKLGIARGEDYKRGVLEELRKQLTHDFDNWVKEDFNGRRLGKISLSVAEDEGNSWDAMTLRDFYNMKKNPSSFDPDEFKKAAKSYNQKHDKPDGWMEDLVAKMENELEAKFQEEFSGSE